MKSTKNIFDQSKNARTILNHEKINRAVVVISDINKYERYYGDFIFVPSTASLMCMYGWMNGYADVKHSEGKGLQSFGITFEAAVYDANYNLVLTCFPHFVGLKCGYFGATF